MERFYAAEDVARALAECEAAVWTEAARFVESLIEPMSPQVAVDTGRMWRTEQTQAIAKALRARAAGQEEAQ